MVVIVVVIVVVVVVVVEMKLKLESVTFWGDPPVGRQYTVSTPVYHGVYYYHNDRIQDTRSTDTLPSFTMLSAMQ